MIILEHIDPKFAVTRDLVLGCLNGKSVNLEQDDPVSLYKNEKGDRLYIGDIGDVLEIRDENVIVKVLDNVHPSEFELTEDEDTEFNEGDSEHLKPKLLGVQMTTLDKMARVCLASEEIVSKTNIIINSIL